jgi:hypothetical protein
VQGAGIRAPRRSSAPALEGQRVDLAFGQQMRLAQAADLHPAAGLIKDKRT